jgi:hypothetical protein
MVSTFEEHGAEQTLAVARLTSFRAASPTVQLALTPDNRWNFATAELVSAASAAGFAAVGINGERVDAAAAGTYAASGVQCHEVLALVVSDDETATIAAAKAAPCGPFCPPRRDNSATTVRRGPAAPRCTRRVSLCCRARGGHKTYPRADPGLRGRYPPPMISASFPGPEVISSMMV